MKKLTILFLLNITIWFNCFATVFTGKIEVKLCLNNEIIIALDGKNSDNIAETAFILQTDNSSLQAENINKSIQNGQLIYQEEYIIIQDGSDYLCYLLYLKDILYSSAMTTTKFYLGFGLSKFYNLTLDLPLPSGNGYEAMSLIESGGGGGSGGSGGTGGGFGGGSSDCGNCSSGGTGSVSCSVNDIWSGCSVTCSSNYFACCKSGNNTCKCCKIKGNSGGIIVSGGNNFSLYPDPSNGTFLIDISEIGYQNVSTIKVTEIQSSTIVYEISADFTDEMSFELNLNNGYHIISIYTSDTVYSTSFLILN